jgi:hypothetical protein
MRSYDERLWAPWNWWVVSGFAALSVWLALEVVEGPWAWMGGGIAVAVTSAALIAYGAARVTVGPDGLRAGKAVLPLAVVGGVRALTADEAARLRGPDYDPQAYHLIRGYISTAVRIELADPTDPTPYWYVATRHPDQLAAGLVESTRR